MTETDEIEAVALPPAGEAAPARTAPVDERGQRWIVGAGWVVVLIAVGFFGMRLARVGIDIRNAFWVFSHPVHERGDIENAFHNGDAVLRYAERLEAKEHPNAAPEPGAATIARPGPMLLDGSMDFKSVHERWQRLRPIYGQIFRGWKETYDTLDQQVASGKYDLDYPPMRLLVMTIWTWHVQARYPDLRAFPYNPVVTHDRRTHRKLVATEELAEPLLELNMWCEGVAAIAMFFLVWFWVRRDAMGAGRIEGETSWRRRWGDPLLLSPVVVLIIFMLVRPLIGWHQDTQMAATAPIDERIVSPAFWIFMVLRFLSAVCLARFLPMPFRAPVCGLVAGMLVWINPALVLDAHAWPQWDVWMLPVFLLAVLAASLDWWLIAGLILGAGCMFKGQVLFVIPMLILWPLLAGWPWRCMRILTGVAIAMAVIVSPWIISNSTAAKYVVGVVAAAGLMFLPASFWTLVAFHPISGLSRGYRYVRGRWDRAHSANPDVKMAGIVLSPHESFGIRWRGGRRMEFRPYFLIGMCISIAAASILVLWARPGISGSMRVATVALLGGIILLPWVLPRRMIATWLVFVLAAGMWISAFGLNGDFSWWDVGFAYGARKYQVMQLGADSLSNLSSILHERYQWKLHDPLGTLELNPLSLNLLEVMALINLVTIGVWGAVMKRRFNRNILLGLAIAPWALLAILFVHFNAQLFDTAVAIHLPFSVDPIKLDLRQTLALIYFITLLLCTIGAAMHSRRNDARVLIALVAPWILFPTLLTQMTARYTTLPAALAAAMVAVSVGMSLWQLLLMLLACCMLGHQLLMLDRRFSPVAYALTHPTHPDMGWLMLLVAAVFLYGAVAPGNRGRAEPALE